MLPFLSHNVDGNVMTTVSVCTGIRQWISFYLIAAALLNPSCAAEKGNMVLESVSLKKRKRHGKAPSE